MSNTQLITSSLINELKVRMKEASSIYILSSFLMKSGVQLLEDSLRDAAERGAEIKVCTGDYLYITQPDALKKLHNFHPGIELRLWRSNGIAFHPKAYMFQYEENGTLIIGSSNMSNSALTTGVEWNVLLKESTNEETFELAIRQFIELFYSDQTIAINDETIKLYQRDYDSFHETHPRLHHKMTEQEELSFMFTPAQNEPISDRIAEEPAPYEIILPRFAQVEALEQLESTVDEGYNKAMVVMATGLGKTYLAGFFSQRFERILFVAHREEILYQAKQSYQKVNSNKVYGIYNGTTKDPDADVIFASIQTLSRKRHLEIFQRDEFDLIVIDEFHHAAAHSYQRVLDYFQPSFLLGITATPDRSDSKDVYAICEGNVAYRIDFMEAIERHWLAPFHYVGVYDETDYSKITWLGKHYDTEELLAVQLKEDMAEKVLEAWVSNKQTRSLGFCSSIRQAEFLSQYFKQKGYRSVALHSQSNVSRKQAIDQLAKAELDIIFTVDLFNEGVDIPSVDTLLFVRPTESLTIFTQQVGRGLRLHSDKDKCVIIDLIGNYRNADIKLSLFDLTPDDKKTKKRTFIPQIPENCLFDVDLRVINLLEELSKKHQPRKEKLLANYRQLKNELGRRPSYLELHLKGTIDVNEYKQEFKTFIAFLEWADELSDEETSTYQENKEWLIEVEKTVMTKSYKMIVLAAMLKSGKSDWYKPITPEEVAPFFHHYLTEKEYRKRIDFSDKESMALWEYDERKVSKLIARMPMSKWGGNSSFENNVFNLHMNVRKEHEDIIYQWTKEICEYRLHRHFERRQTK